MQRARFACLMFFCCGAACAGYSMEAHVIAGGGGVSSGGGYTLRGTVAQPVAGLSDTGARRLWSGFWGPRDAAPTGDAIFHDGFEEGVQQ